MLCAIALGWGFAWIADLPWPVYMLVVAAAGDLAYSATHIDRKGPQ
jgi:hypothetical protein